MVVFNQREPPQPTTSSAVAKQLGLLKLHQSNTKSEQPYSTLLEALAASLVTKMHAKCADDTAAASSTAPHTTPASHLTATTQATARPTAATPRTSAFTLTAPIASAVTAPPSVPAVAAVPQAKAAFAATASTTASSKSTTTAPVSSNALTSTAFTPASLALMSRMKHNTAVPATNGKPQPEEEKQQPPSSAQRRVQRAEESDELLMEEFDEGDTGSKTTSATSRITAARTTSSGNTARTILTPASATTAAATTLFPPPPTASPTAITLQDAQTLRQLTFGAASATNTQMFSQSWKQQGFYFTQHAALPFGLVQRDGGPCGLIAAVQAEVLRELLWGEWRTVHGVREVSEADQQRALVHALAAMLWRAGGGKLAKLVIEGGKSSAGTGSVKGYKPDGITECLLVHTATSYPSLCSLLYHYLSLYLHPHSHGLVLALYSLCLSRGLTQLAGDYDYDGCVLIGQHSYCTQELVNLAIAGTAVSNVFDGHKAMDGMAMKGIAVEGSGATVGFVSLFEHYGYVEVGRVLKQPRYPVWIVCSESHYSVLYCEDGKQQSQEAGGWQRFDLFYYDELIKQQEVIRLTVDCTVTSSDAPRSKDLEPPLNDCIRTRWGKHARVSWNGTEPIL